MASYGPTMIIERCQSAHKLAPNAVWDSPASHGSIRTASGSGSSLRQSSDTTTDTDMEEEEDDEEQQLLRKSSSHGTISTTYSMSLSQRAYGSFLMPLQQSAQHQPSLSLLRKRGKKTPSSKKPKESIRFQVVVWDVGPVDVALGRVPMTFRVTMFWEDVQHEELSVPQVDDAGGQRETQDTNELHTEWTMSGRRKAYERIVQDDNILHVVDVPPISLLNVVTFDVIGHPEICVLRQQERVLTKHNSNTGGPTSSSSSHNDANTTTSSIRQTRRLMRWTCLYQATLMQQGMRLDEFPHDEHVLQLKIGVLVHRRPGGRWDKTKYQLALATEDDSQYSTRIPHGLIVDHARVPNFTYDPDEGLDFQFVPLSLFGQLPIGNSAQEEQEQPDHCLEVRLRVKRDSGYYDKNIMPLIGLLNVVAVSIPLSLECVYFFQRGLMLLNITFVQIGIRMNVDKHLPSVGYQIKMQRIMNHFFFSLLLLVLESSLVYILNDQYGWPYQATHLIDKLAASVSFGHIVFTWVYYYTHLFDHWNCGFLYQFFRTNKGKPLDATKRPKQLSV